MSRAAESQTPANSRPFPEAETAAQRYWRNIRAAREFGRDEGERTGYRSGMRWGMLAGMVWGVILVCGFQALSGWLAGL